MNMNIVTTVVALLAISSPVWSSMEFQDGTGFEMSQSRKEGWSKKKEVSCVYTYKGVDEVGHWFTTNSECGSPITEIWLHRETGEYIRWINVKSGASSKNLEREGDALFLSGGPGEKWGVSYTDRWNDESRSGRWKGRCRAKAGEAGNDEYTVNCHGGIVGDGMTVRYRFTVSTKTGLWKKVVYKNSRGLEIVWEMTRLPQVK